jgi:soluble lytic murein transglycosylase-like protein
MIAPWRWFFGLSLGRMLVVLACLPLLVLNLAVAFFGRSYVFPLSPFFLREKVHALEAYAKHRPTCLLRGHDDISRLVDAAERRHQLPRGLLRAVVTVESNNRPHRISFAGAMGPAQLMPGTASLLRVIDPFEPEEAIDAGARYLAQQLRRKGRIDLAVAAYNAGPGAVRGAVPNIPETKLYVAKVLREMNR